MYTRSSLSSVLSYRIDKTSKTSRKCIPWLFFRGLSKILQEADRALGRHAPPEFAIQSACDGQASVRQWVPRYTRTDVADRAYFREDVLGHPVGLTLDGKKSFLRGQCHRREPRIQSSQDEHHRAYNSHKYLQHCLTTPVELYRIVVLVEDGRVLKRDGW